MLLYWRQNDELVPQPTTPPIDEGEWWAGAMSCMAGLALVAGLSANQLAAQRAGGFQYQDDLPIATAAVLAADQGWTNAALTALAAEDASRQTVVQIHRGQQFHDPAVARPAHPNLPPGFTVRLDEPFDSLSGPLGSGVHNGLWTNPSITSITSDPAAPESVPNILQRLYPSGSAFGPTGFAEQPFVSSTEVYISDRMMLSNPWTFNPSSVNKQWFIGTNENLAAVNQIICSIIGTTIGNAKVGVGVQSPTQTSPNYIAPGVFANNIAAGLLGTLAAWHQIEVYMRGNTGPNVADGLLKVWVDGVLVSDNSDVIYCSTGPGRFRYIQNNAYWGGSSGTHDQDDYVWNDHLFIASIAANDIQGDDGAYYLPPLPQAPAIPRQPLWEAGEVLPAVVTPVDADPGYVAPLVTPSAPLPQQPWEGAASAEALPLLPPFDLEPAFGAPIVGVQVPPLTPPWFGALGDDLPLVVGPLPVDLDPIYSVLPMAAPSSLPPLQPWQSVSGDVELPTTSLLVLVLTDRSLPSFVLTDASVPTLAFIDRSMP